MSKDTLIKRAVIGGYIKADTTGTGEWETGRIIDTNATNIVFVSAMDGAEVSVRREHTYKATRAEYEAALPVKEAANSEAAEEPEQPEFEPAGLTDMEDDADMDAESDADMDAEPDAESGMVKRKYRERYRHVKINGRSTQICGDSVSEQMVKLDLVDAYKLVSQEMGIDPDELVARYEHLNNGQQKMCLSNRLRAFRRKAQQ